MESQKKPIRTFSLKAMFVVVALCAFLLFWMAPSTMTLRLDYGSSGYMGGLLYSGDVVDVIAITATGSLKTVARRAVVVGEPRMVFNGSTTYYFITIKTRLVQQWTIGGYPNYAMTLHSTE